MMIVPIRAVSHRSSTITRWRTHQEARAFMSGILGVRGGTGPRAAGEPRGWSNPFWRKVGRLGSRRHAGCSWMAGLTWPDGAAPDHRP